MGKKRVLVGYGVDIDAIAGWLGSYKGEDSTSDVCLSGSLSWTFHSISLRIDR